MSDVPEPDPLKLVWGDEFDTDGPPDSSKWKYDTGGGGWGNKELQHYTDRPVNAYVADGHLRICAVKEKFQENEYTSAKMVSKHLGDFKYGRISVRASLNKCRARGAWPAIWMLPTDRVYGKWPNSGEIDIMEHVGHIPGTCHGSIHTKAFNHLIGTQKGCGHNIDVAKWHVYEIIWTEEEIKFIVDNHVYYEYVKAASSGWENWPFDKDFHLLLNVAVGGSWGGANGVDDAEFEGEGQAMLVDWVRVYSI